jgi:hypothetical protein
MSSSNQILLKNCLRLTVRTDGAGPDAILSVVGAVNTQRYECRRAELAFVEDGVRVAAGEGLDTIALEGWPTLAELVADANSQEIIAYACTDCAASRGVAAGDVVIDRTRWVPTEDIHLPLHACSKSKSSEPLELRTVAEQRAEQQQFDTLVGHVTIGADRGET